MVDVTPVEPEQNIIGIEDQRLAESN
jgi:hypothetical protein